MALAQASSVFARVFQRVVPSLVQQCPTVSLRATACERSVWGDFQCNAALTLSGADKAPAVSARHIAEEVVEQLKKEGMVERAQVTGPGFVTMFAKHDWICEQLRNPRPATTTSSPQRVIVDMSSPNTAKRMHIGHLRSTVLGDTFARVLQSRGHEVQRINHVGDWGTQFGMLLAFLETCPTPVDSMDVVSLEESYRGAKKRFSKCPEFRELSRKRVLELQSGDPDAIRVWKTICSVSRASFEQVYARLGIEGLQERGESTYNHLLQPTVQHLLRTGVAQRSDNAVVVFDADGKGEFPLIVQKSDGGFTYDCTDLAALSQRLGDDAADRVIYVTDVGQSEHFRKVFEAATRAGVLQPHRHRVEFVGHGVILGPDGKKFRTRQGDAVKLEDVLDEATKRASEVVSSRPDEFGIGPGEADEIAASVAISCVKYAELSKSRLSNYTFSYDAMLDFRGNTGVYLLYAYTRLCSLLRKADPSWTPEAVLPFPDDFDLRGDFERSLALLLIRKEDVIDDVAADLRPHHLCSYLYDLASAVNALYNNQKVLQNPRRLHLLALLDSSRRTLFDGFTLLGLKPLLKI